jgi:hypothetical protein
MNKLNVMDELTIRSANRLNAVIAKAHQEGLLGEWEESRHGGLAACGLRLSTRLPSIATATILKAHVEIEKESWRISGLDPNFETSR